MKEAAQAIQTTCWLNNIWWHKSSLLQISVLHWARILNERPGVGDNAEHLVSLTDSRPLTGSERSIVHPDHPLAGCTDEEINKSFEKPNHRWSNFMWAVSSWWSSRSWDLYKAEVLKLGFTQQCWCKEEQELSWVEIGSLWILLVKIEWRQTLRLENVVTTLGTLGLANLWDKIELRGSQLLIQDMLFHLQSVGPRP